MPETAEAHGRAQLKRPLLRRLESALRMRTVLAPGSVADFFLRANAGRYVPDTTAPKFLDSAAPTFARNAWRLIGTWQE